jgi:phosphatidylinositol 4-phosphatase
VITDRSKVGKLNGHDVFRLTNYRVLRVPRNDNHLSDEQKQDDNQYLRLVRSMLDTKCFYFSYGYDLCNSAQCQFDAKKDVPLWKRADERFFWNKFMMRRFIEASADPDLKLGKFILPLMLGCTVQFLITTTTSFVTNLFSNHHQFSTNNSRRNPAVFYQ